MFETELCGLFWIRNWRGGGMAILISPPPFPSGYAPGYVGSCIFSLYRIFSKKEISNSLIPKHVSYLFFDQTVTKSHISEVWNCYFRF